MKNVSGLQRNLLIGFGIIIVLAVAIFSGYLPIGRANQQRADASLSGEVTIWGILHPSIVNSALRALEGENENKIKIKYVQKNIYQLELDYTEALAKGVGPDLLIFSNLQLLALSDKLYNIPYQSLPRSQFEKDYVDSAHVFLGGYGVIGLPFAQDPLVMYFNKDILARYFMYEPPKYWDEYHKFSETVTQRQGPVVTTSAIAMGTFDNINNAQDILAMLFLQINNPISRPAGGGYQVTLESDFIGFRGATQAALDFFLSFANTQTLHYSWNSSKRSAKEEFLSGNLATYIGYASESGDFLASNPNLNVGVALVPQWRDLNSSSFSRLYAFGINGRSPNLSLAFEVMWQLSGRRLGTFLGQSLGMQPVFRNQLGTGPEASTYVKVLRESAFISKSWPDPNPAQSIGLFREMINDIISGIIDQGTAISRLTRELHKLYE